MSPPRKYPIPNQDGNMNGKKYEDKDDEYKENNPEAPKLMKL